MALQRKSLFLYNYSVTSTNRSLDFKTSGGGAVVQATLNLGYYSLTGLLAEVVRAMTAAAPSFIFTATADRTISGGLQNRITIATNGSYLDLLFLSGPRTASNCAGLLGFAVADRTGALTYTGTLTTGTSLVPELVGYSYLGPDFMQNAFGAMNITASGKKEAIVWAIQKFFQVEFRYEPESKVILQWTPFFQWAIQQRLFEFTPDINSPSTIYECTLESSPGDSKGMGFRVDEMLPDFPFYYKTGLMKFRQKI